jgi:hypothetical protein
MCFGTSNSYAKGRTDRTGRLQTAWWCAWPRRNGRGGTHAKPKHWTCLCQGMGLRPGLRARGERLPRAPRGGVGMADLRVGSARLVRLSPREDVLVSGRAGRCRTAIARAVRGTPNRSCGIAAAAPKRAAVISRGNPAEPIRRGRGESVVATMRRNARRAFVRLSSSPAGR